MAHQFGSPAKRIQVGFKSKDPRHLVLILLALAGLLASSAAGGRAWPGGASQQAKPGGRIEGVVKDGSGAVIPGALVRLIPASGEDRQQTITDSHGRFSFLNLAAGEFELSAELAGFKRRTQIVRLAEGERKEIEIFLALGAVTEEVTVTSGARVSKAVSRVAPDESFNTESYDFINENKFTRVREDSRSTFSIDVDTASYSNVRRFLTDGQLPPVDAVRIEELINYFSYDHPAPVGSDPFEVSVEVASAPWKPSHRLLSIGIQGRKVDLQGLPPSNFVFLIDVSGSMASPDKLPLLRRGLRFLVEQMGGQDQISIVVYAGAAGIVLPPTRGSRKSEILQALEDLEAGGSTNGGEGIQLAYKLAADHFLKGGNNRVILATDGDFNVGISSQGDLIRLIQEESKKGVYLTVLGFGTGNLKDSTMEKLAQYGNGNYSYIDSALEARKVLVEEVGSTLLTIAEDVKVQLEFNPLQVESFRLLGYENRLLRHDEFDDDEKDAGEIGAGHSLTVLYEIVPVGEEPQGKESEPLRYQASMNPSGEAYNGELLFIRLRYKNPGEPQSLLIERPVVDDGATFELAGTDLRFAASVAAFGMLLRDSPNKGEATYRDVLRWARSSLGSDPGGYRMEFVDLVQRAREVTASAVRE